MKKIFLDMDGVLCDFCRGYLEHYQIPVKESEITYWEFILDWWVTNKRKSIAEFWAGLDTEFWKNLHKTKECDQILALVEPYKPVLLTSPPLGRTSHEAIAGKSMWIKNHLPDYFYDGRFLIGPAKEYCSHAGTVLIDDSQENCSNWVAEGGYAILVPRPWNDFRKRPVVESIQEDLVYFLREEY